MKGAYYNEIDPYAAQWLRNLIAAGHLPAGDVDERSIVDVGADDLAGYRQCHFFAGIGGWALAATLAGWPEDRELWTGSPPCQPFSVAGKQRGTDDERHLWPHLFRLASARRPAVLMGEQVAAAVGKDWLDGVFADLEGIGYACGALVVPACAVNAPHRRDRLWFVADANGTRSAARISGSVAREEGHAGVADYRGGESDVADSNRGRLKEQPERDGEPFERGQPAPRGLDAIGSRARDGALADSSSERRQQIAGCAHGDECAHEGAPAQHDYIASGDDESGPWARHSWIIGHDGKARRVEPGLRLLAHRVPARVGKLRAYGNAIAPQVAAEVIAAYMEARP